MRRLVGSCVALALGVSAVAVSVASPVAAASVPPGFADSAVASFSRPTAVEWLPDSRIVVLEQDGRLRVGGPTGGFSTAISVGVFGCTDDERGLLGFTHDPAFQSNGFVYVYYTHSAPSLPGGCVNRVSRFTLSGATIDPASEVVLLDNISSVNGNHNGGDLDIGSDGFLYVSVGDAGRDPRGDSGFAGANDAAQDLSLLNGKILRITLDGQPAPGNPVSGPGSAQCATRGNTPSTPTTWCQELFAWGLRNPYRFAFDRNDGSDRFFINDVGQGTREEIDLGRIGGNYGWPAREGSCPQGDDPPCDGPAVGLVDPLTDYHSDGNYITGGAFIPNGLWPAGYDGAYFFGDGGSGEIWVRFADGSVNYGAPFATGASGLTDMTFGFDANGRMVLYYVGIGSGLRKITPTTPAASSARNDLRMIPVTPFRAYDTGPNEPAVGVAPGKVFNGTTRRIDLHPPGAFEAALVNVTYDNNAGAGFVRLWGTHALRPVTSSLNADAANTIGANAAIVPLDAAGRFMLESTITGRVIVDVMAWLDDTGGAVSAGRFVALTPQRLVDTRIPAGTTLESGSDNPFTRSGGDIEFDADGRLGVPSDGTASAVVVSIGAIAGPGPGGFAGAFPTGTTWSNTSNINVVGADIRANMVVVPFGSNGHVSVKTLNIADAVVDVLGYITSASAPASTSGRYSSIDSIRIVDTRVPLGFTRLGEGSVSSIGIPGAAGASAVVQNVTVTNTAGPGWVATFPESATPPLVSNLNYATANQSRAALAFTSLPASKSVSYRSLVPTELVVDVVGTFSA